MICIQCGARGGPWSLCGTCYHHNVLEIENMCKEPKAGRKEAKTEECVLAVKCSKVTEGSTWYIEDREIVVEHVLLQYYNNGNGETPYLSFQWKDTKKWAIITHTAFKSSAKLETKPVERHVTPRELMLGGVCSEGAYKLGVMLAGMAPGSEQIMTSASAVARITQRLVFSGKWKTPMSVQHLWDKHLKMYGGDEPSNTELLYVAKVLNLVPKESAGPDRYTLLRLLGIKP